MFVKLTSFILLGTLLTACGASAPEEDEKTSNGGSSSTGIITSVASQNSSSEAMLSSNGSSSSRSMAVSSLMVSSSSSLMVSSSSSSANLATAIIQWEHPNKRENGDFLELDDIGGYDIRVLNPISGNYTHYPINNNSTTQYTLPNYQSNMTVEIAVFDTTGLYSQYITVTN